MFTTRTAFAIALIATTAPALAASPIPAESRQLLVVTTPGWASVTGSLQRFERDSNTSPWSAVGSPVDVVVGRNGMAWGLGLHTTLGFLPEPGEALKQEGDGNAPAGAFSLGTAFGVEPALPRATNDTRSYPYIQATENLRCVDDMNSPYYNEILDVRELGLEGGGELPWSSDEHMLRATDGLYRAGIVVKHNMAPAVMGMGSCIFMHIWRGPDRGTAGCTAMEEPNLFTLALWLDGTSRPTLVQLPQGRYEALKSPWELP